MAKHAHLTSEVECILLAPYPASLRKLNVILRQIDPAVIIAWARSKPCQIGHLLDVLVSRAGSDTEASDALDCVLRCPTIFDTFLQQHSSSLDRLYSRQLRILGSEASSNGASANSNQETGSQSPISTVLLRVPDILPQNNGVPSSYYAYLECVIRGNEDETVGHWQMRVYAFFAEAPLDLLSALSEPTIQFASDRWKILFRSKDLAENLCASYISCRLQRHAAALLHNDSSPGSCPAVCPTLRAWIDKCHRTFHGQNCLETVKRILVRVLALTYHEAYRDVEAGDLAIALAGDVLAVARQNYVADWANDTGEYTHKIAEKFGGAGTRLQTALIHIFVVLEPNAWLFDSVNICTKVLQTLTATADASEASPHPEVTTAETLLRAADQCMSLTSLDQSVRAFASFVKNLFNFVIDQCCPSRATADSKLAGIAQALRIVEALRILERKGPSTLGTIFMKAVEELGMPEWWTLNLRTPGSPENCCGLPSCLHHEEVQRQKLCDQVTLLLFSCGSAAGRQLPYPTIELLSQRFSQACLGDQPSSCVYYPFLRLQQTPIVSQQADLTSHNWRAYLQEAFKCSSDESQNLVENVITMVCKDLENRCETVEVPLRAAHTEVHELTAAIEELEGRIASMALDKDRLEGALHSQQAARDHDSTVSAELVQTITSLNQQLNEAQQQVNQMRTEKAMTEEQARRQVEDVKQKARQEIEMAQQQHATKVCELEAHLNSQDQANNALEHESAWIKEQTDLARQELVVNHEEGLEQLNRQHADEINSLKLEISQLQDNAAARAQELTRLTGGIQARDESIEELSRDHDEYAQQITALQTQLASLNADKAAISTELAEAQTTNRTLSSDLAVKVDGAEKHIQRISELETIATRTQQRCTKLERALAEARQREEGISALLAGGVPGVPNRRTTLAAPAVQGSTQSVENFNQGGVNAQQTSAARLPENSFLTDDDEHYYEIMKL